MGIPNKTHWDFWVFNHISEPCYTAPEAAYCSYSDAVRHRAGIQPRTQRKSTLTDFGLQPYNIALVCRSMLSTLVIHVITWITIYLPTLERW